MQKMDISRSPMMMAQAIKETLRMDYIMGKEHLHGQMGTNMKENSKKDHELKVLIRGQKKEKDICISI